MKKSTRKLLETLNSGGKISNRVLQETIEHCVSNGYILFDDNKGWLLTKFGYDAYLRGR